MKKQTETINVEITVDHYGFYPNDRCLGDVSKSYKDWVEKTHLVKWDDYECGSLMTDVEIFLIGSSEPDLSGMELTPLFSSFPKSKSHM